MVHNVLYPEQLALENWIVLPFFTGINTTENTLSLKFSSTYFNPGLKTLTIDVQSEF